MRLTGEPVLRRLIGIKVSRGFYRFQHADAFLSDLNAGG